MPSSPTRKARSDLTFAKKWQYGKNMWPSHVMVQKLLSYRGTSNMEFQESADIQAAGRLTMYTMPWYPERMKLQYKAKGWKFIVVTLPLSDEDLDGAEYDAFKDFVKGHTSIFEKMKAIYQRYVVEWLVVQNSNIGNVLSVEGDVIGDPFHRWASPTTPKTVVTLALWKRGLPHGPDCAPQMPPLQDFLSQSCAVANKNLSQALTPVLVSIEGKKVKGKVVLRAGGVFCTPNVQELERQMSIVLHVSTHVRNQIDNKAMEPPSEEYFELYEQGEMANFETTSSSTLPSTLERPTKYVHTTLCKNVKWPLKIDKMLEEPVTFRNFPPAFPEDRPIDERETRSAKKSRLQSGMPDVFGPAVLRVGNVHVDHARVCLLYVAQTQPSTTPSERAKQPA